MPDLSGLSEKEAEKVIGAAGLVPGERTTKIVEEPGGTVIDQRPPHDAQVSSGQSVDLVIGVGRAPPDKKPPQLREIIDIVVRELGQPAGRGGAAIKPDAVQAAIERAGIVDLDRLDRLLAVEPKEALGLLGGASATAERILAALRRVRQEAG